jgi:bifunctional non-homologous end joining protein LigD
VRLFTRNGYNFADRFPMIVAALKNLPVRSCFIDGEAIVVDRSGLSVFDLLRYRQHDRAAVLCAFDLIELDGEDLRRSPFEHRKRALAECCAGGPTALPSMSITRAMALPSTRPPARWVAKALCPSS